ncbi:hypothetical protein MKX08_003378 [Trichoderma sp. CBMAI-0020]|nr:hypothetical protein MKX08_003378 [Trichoderma sp. CBMAI-0020]
MGTQVPGQEWLDAYRHQLATMAYAVAAAQYHRMPAARSTFKPLMGKIIHNMLRREAWGYWFLTSHSGSLVDPDLKELRKPWEDPICKENIMNDSMVFNWNPVYWGFGPEKYSYSLATLQEAILKEMEANGWIGVCCEPNMVFIACNQFPLTAMQINDVRNGGNVADEVLAKYKAAWQKKGMMGKDGLLRDAYRTKQVSSVDAFDIGFPAWAAAHMAWNIEQMEHLYPKRSDAHKIYAKARELAAKASPQYPSFMHSVYGWVIEWAAEVPAEDLDGLLKHADQFFGPQWENGGLFYPRNDTQYDSNDNHVYVEPLTGNVGIAYAQLTVKRGQATMWNRPWTKENVRTMPWIDGGQLERGKGRLVCVVSDWHGRRVDVGPGFKQLLAGRYGVYVDGSLREEAVVRTGEDVRMKLEIGGYEIDVVAVRA